MPPVNQTVRAPLLRMVHGSGLVCSIPAGVGFDPLRARLREELSASAERYRGASLRLDLGHGELSLFDLRRLMNLLKNEYGIEVIGLQCTAEAVHRYVERELKLKIQIIGAGAPIANSPAASAPGPADRAASNVTSPDSPTVVSGATTKPASPHPEADDIEPGTDIVAPPDPDVERREADTSQQGDRLLTINGTVRAGSVITFGGDIQVFGDVNPGGHLIAGGNIVVLGALKGFAHAGSRLGESACIFAFDMRPTQLRIGKVIQMLETSNDARAASGRLPPVKQLNPEIAVVSGGTIIIEPYRGRMPGSG